MVNILERLSNKRRLLVAEMTCIKPDEDHPPMPAVIKAAQWTSRVSQTA